MRLTTEAFRTILNASFRMSNKAFIGSLILFTVLLFTVHFLFPTQIVWVVWPTIAALTLYIRWIHATLGILITSTESDHRELVLAENATRKQLGEVMQVVQALNQKLSKHEAAIHRLNSITARHGIADRKMMNEMQAATKHSTTPTPTTDRTTPNKQSKKSQEERDKS